MSAALDMQNRTKAGLAGLYKYKAANRLHVEVSQEPRTCKIHLSGQQPVSDPVISHQCFPWVEFICSPFKEVPLLPHTRCSTPVFREPQYSDGLWDGRPGFDSLQVQGTSLFSTMCRLALGPTQLPLQWVLEALSSGVK
jgi:hypothetical protein